MYQAEAAEGLKWPSGEGRGGKEGMDSTHHTGRADRTW